MKIISEKTKKEYPTVEACLEDEAKFDAEQAKIAEEKRIKAEEKKARAKEVEDAYKAVVDANKHYLELRNKFVKDYGSFHMTFTDKSKRTVDPMLSWFDEFFGLL